MEREGNQVLITSLNHWGKKPLLKVDFSVSQASKFPLFSKPVCEVRFCYLQLPNYEETGT